MWVKSKGVISVLLAFFIGVQSMPMSSVADNYLSTPTSVNGHENIITKQIVNDQDDILYQSQGACAPPTTEATTDEIIEQVQEDLEPPTKPENLRAISVEPTQATIAWEPSTDNNIECTIEYVVYKDEIEVSVTTANAIELKSLTPETQYNFCVESRDNLGNTSEPSNLLSITTPAFIFNITSNLLNPPQNLRALNITENSVKLGWDAPEETIGIIVYDIYKNSELLASDVSNLDYLAENLTSGTEYVFTVMAKNDGGSISTKSQELRVATDTVFNSDVTLSEDKVVAGNLYINNGTTNLNGKKLTVKGNVIHYNGVLNINGGQLLVTGNYRLQAETKNANGTVSYSRSYGYLWMVNSSDYVKVDGNFVTQAYYENNKYLTGGILEIKGDFYQYTYSRSQNFYATGTHKTILSGSGLQTVYFQDAQSRFSIIEIQNYSEEGVLFTTPLNATTLITNGCVVKFPGSEVMGWTLSDDETHEGNLNLGGGVLNLNGHTLTVNGDLIHSGGTIDTNGGKLIVTGDYRLQTAKESNGAVTYSYSNGYLKMVNAADYVFVGGNFITQSQNSHDNLLTAGTLEVKGNFTQSTYWYNFRTKGTHKVILSGDTVQTVSFSNPGSSNSCFNSLEMTNTSETGIDFSAKAVIIGELKQTTSKILRSENIALAASAVINWNTWNYSITFEEARTLNRYTTIKGNLYINNNLTLNGFDLGVEGHCYINGGTTNLNGKKLTVNGNLIHGSGTLYINGGQADIAGDYRIQRETKQSNGTVSYRGSNGYLRMINSADHVKVDGNFVTQAYSSHNGYLTGGILEVKGNFYQYTNYYSQNFYATGTHKTILSGSGLQTVYFQDAQSKFNIIEVQNYSDEGVLFTTSLNATTLITNGCVVKFPGSEVMGWTLSEDEIHEGNLNLGGGVLDLNGHTLTVNGDLIHSGGTIDIKGGKLIVTGDYRLQTAKESNGTVSYSYSNGYLKMVNAADYVFVGGNFITQSQNSHDNLLTAGTLEVKGNFTQSTYWYNFRTKGTHKVILSGDTVQTVSFSNPGSSNSCFNSLEMTNTSETGIDFSAKAVIIGELKQTTSKILRSENIALAASAVINWNTWNYSITFEEARTLNQYTTIKGNLYINNNLTLNGFDLGVEGHCYINGGTTNLNGKKLTVNGNLIHSNGTLNIYGGQLIVSGNYRIQRETKNTNGTVSYSYGNGYLIMTNSADHVKVGGNFVTQAYSSHNGYLTGGILEVKGGFYQYTYSRSQNFYATGTHKTILSGSGLQTVYFQDAQSKFNIIEIQNYSEEGVLFTTPLNATTLITNGCVVKFPGSEVMGWTLSDDETHKGNLNLGGGVLNLNGHTLTVNGDLIHSGGTIDINGGKLIVTGDYRLQTAKESNGAVTYSYSNGYLKMVNAADYVLVGGNFITQSQYSHSGLLTAGTLEVKGNFTQSTYQYNFRATGTHKVILSGDVAQTVTFSNPSSNYSFFNSLEMTNTSEAGIDFSTKAVVIGELKQTISKIVGSENVALAASAIINWNTWNYSITFEEARTLNQYTTIKGNLYINNNLTLNDFDLDVTGHCYINGGTTNLNGKKLTVNGNLIHSNGTLNIYGGQLIVSGNYRIQRETKNTNGTVSYSYGNGYLIMTNSADHVKVGGNFVTQAYSSHNGYLTGGILEVKGGFYQYTYSRSQNFYATGTHKTILSGSGLQTVYFQDAQSKFNIIEIQNYSDEGVLFTTPLNATTLITNGCVVKFPGSEVMGWTLSEDEIHEGNLNLGGGVLDLNGHTLTVNGDLIHSGGTIDIKGGKLIVTGDYRLQTAKESNGAVTYSYSNGYLKMVNAADYVLVGGNFITQSQYSHSGLLTAGTLEVKGNFTQSTYQYNFRATGTHKVILSGDVAQTVTFSNPSSNYSFFNSLEMTNTSEAGIDFSTKAVVIGELKQTISKIVGSENVALAASAIINWNTWNYSITFEEARTLNQYTTIKGNLYINNNLTLNDFDLDVTGHCYINGGTTNLNGKKLTVNGNLIHSNGTLNIYGGQLIVSGNYRIQRETKNTNGTVSYSYGNGYLIMTNSADHVKVGGNFVTQAYSSHNGYLTGGILEVKGGFYQYTYSRSQNFYATGTHKTILSGSGLQTVYFQDAQSKFNIIEIQNYSDEGVLFTTPLNATTLITNGCVVKFPGSEVMGWTLSEDEIHEGNLNLGGGVLDLNGHTLTVNGDLIHSGGTIDIKGGKLIVTGDYRLQTAKESNGTVSYSYSNGYLKMVNAADYVFVGGNFITQSQNSHDNLLTAGTLEVKGNFTQSTYWYNFRTKGTHKVILSGDTVQTVSFSNPGSSNSCFNSLEMTNTSETGIDFSAKAVIIGELKQTTSKILRSENVALAASAVINWDTWNYSITFEEARTLNRYTTIKGNLYINNNLTLNGFDLGVEGHCYINGGTTNLNGKKLTVNGNLIHGSGTLYINGGQADIAGDYRIQRETKQSNGTVSYSGSNGYLRMINSADHVKVGGNFVTQPYSSHNGYLTGGILEVKGGFYQYTYSRSQNFYATGTHKTILSGSGLQTVYFQDAQSRFNILVITKPIEIGYNFSRTPVWTQLIEEPRDDETPTAPTNLTVTDITASTLKLSWEASSDNVGVAGYDIYRNNIRIGATSGTEFADSRLIPDTEYTYYVMAYDIMRNQSDSSNAVTVTTDTDTIAPSTPTNLRISSRTASSVSLIWTGSSDNVQVLGYRIYRNDEEVGFSNGASFNNINIEPSTYTFYVKAVDAANNLSGASNSIIYDNEPPTAPELTAISKASTQIVLSWSQSSDNIGVTGYELYRNGTRIRTQTALTYTDSGLSPDTEYTYYVKAYDAAGNRSVGSNILVLDTIIDTEAPSKPQNLNVYSKTAKTATIKWSPAIDNVSVKGYEIYRDGVLIGASTTNSYKDSNLTSNITYKYSVLAYDSAGNKSTISDEISVIPLAPHISRVTPVNGEIMGGVQGTNIFVYFTNTQNALGSTAKFEYSSDGEVWTAIDDKVYGPSSNLSEAWHYCNWNLSDVESGYYFVRYTVTDESGISDTITVTYQVDRDAPAAPQNLNAESGSGVIYLTWEPCIEADVKNYKIYRSESVEGIFTNIAAITKLDNLAYIDGNVEPGQTYYYKITSLDKFNQESQYSNLTEAIAVLDTTPPVVLGIEPLTGTIIGLNAVITVRAEDNLQLSSITLQYLNEDGLTWNDIKTIASNGTAVFNWNTVPLVNSVKVRAIARDAAGNESNGSPERVYTIDNQGPQKVTSFKATPATTVITLHWDDVADQDLSHFQVEWKDSEEGEFVYYNKTSTTLGMHITDLKPLKGYWFKVIAYDIYGNRGNESDVIKVETLADLASPVVSSISPTPSRRQSNIPLKAEVRDDVGVLFFKFQMSRDLHTWIDIKEFTLGEAKKNASFTYDYDVSALAEGSCYIRGVAKDEVGNESNTVQALTIEYIIDRTAPAAPTGLEITPSMSYLGLSWEQGNEVDLAYYRLYRSETEDGTYSIVANNISALGYVDRNILYNNTYYYKVQAVDLAGNESVLTEPISGELLADTQKPVVYSMNCPSYNGVLPANPNISIFAGDNYMLSNITLEYRINNNSDDDWVIIGTKDVSSVSEVYAIRWNTNNLSEDDYLIRAIATDAAGNVSEPLTASFKLNLLPPSTPILTATPGGWKVELSWETENEVDLAGFRIYRSTSAGGAFKLVKETTKTSFVDEFLNPAQTYYYKVQSLDIYGNESWSNVDVAIPLNEDLYDPVAVAGSNILTLINMEVAFDGTMSSDNDKISSYIWDFGDGSTSQIAKPTHIYTQAGDYQVVLTVCDSAGNTAQDVITVTVKDLSQTGVIQVKVVDRDTGATIPGANVFILDSSGETYNTYADSQGIAKIVCHPGKIKISAYKVDYMPASVETNIIVGQTVSQTIGLESGNIVVGNLTVRRMSLNEIVDLGIDVNAPENQYVYIYNVVLGFGDCEFLEDIIINGEGKIIGNHRPISINGGAYVAEIIPITHPKHPEVRPTIAYMVMPGGASWLKEYFEVELALENTADSEFILDNSTAELKLPRGLEIVPTKSTAQSLLVDLGSIAGGEKRNVKWIITSTESGYYNLEAEFNGTLLPFEEPVKTIFRTSEPFRVWGSQAFNMHIEADDWAVRGEEYLVKVGLENVSDVPVYKVKLLIAEGLDYYLAGSQLPYAEIGELKPGETLWIEFKLIPLITGELNLENCFSISTGEATIDTSFRAIPSPLLFDTAADNFEIQLDGSYIFNVKAKVINYKNYAAINSYARLNIDSEGLELIKCNNEIDLGNIEPMNRFNYPKMVTWKIKTKPGFDFSNCNLSVTVWADNARGNTKNVRKISPPTIALEMPERVIQTKDGYDGNPFKVTSKITNNDIERKSYCIYIKIPSELVNISQKEVFQTVSVNAGETISQEWWLEAIPQVKAVFATVEIYVAEYDNDQTTSTFKSIFIPVHPEAARELKLRNKGKTDPKSYVADPIDTSTGAHVIEKTLLSVNGAIPIDFKIEYNSNLLNDGAMGRGWHHNYEAKLDELEDKNILIKWNSNMSNLYYLNERGQYIGRDKSTSFDEITKNEDGSYILKRKDQTKYIFDRNGRMTEIVDRNGKQLILTYDNDSRLKYISEPISTKKLTFNYNAKGLLLSVRDGLNREVLFTYYGANILSSIIDVESNMTTYTYNSDGRVLTGTDSRGVEIFSNTYDDYGRVVLQYDGMVKTPTIFKYDTDNESGLFITKVSDRNGTQKTYTHDSMLYLVSDSLGSSYTYDERGNRRSVTDANGNTTLVDYDEYNNPIAITDAMGNVTHMTYDESGNLLLVRYPDGNTLCYVYDENNNLLSEIDELGNKTEYSYNSYGLIETVTNPMWAITKYSYNKGLISKVEDPVGNTSTFEYDAAGRVTKITDSLGHSITTEYDNSGNVVKMTDRRGYSRSYTYDCYGNMLSETDSEGNMKNYSFDKNGKVDKSVDAMGNATFYEYDGEDRLIKTTFADGSAVSFKYDELDRLIEVTDQLGNKISNQYDPAGNIIATLDPYNNIIAQYTYNPNNLPVTQKTALGDIITYSYSKRNNVMTTVNSEGAKTTNTYDPTGKLLKTTDAVGKTTSYTYDSIGRILTETMPNKGVKTYTYYLNDKVKTVKDPAGNITTYGYDAAGRLIKETNALGKSTRFAYDENGNVICVTDALGNKVTYEYNSLNLKTKEIDAKGSTTSYTYNANGQLTKVTNAIGNVTQYEYDSMNRIVKIIDAKGNATVMEYDLKGRQTKVTDALGNSLSMTYDAKDNLVSKKDALGVEVFSATYDAAGNMLTQTDSLGNTTESSYDKLGRLTEIINEMGYSTVMSYDNMNILTDVADALEGISSRTFDYGGNIHTLTDPNNNIQTFEYDEANRLILETTAVGSSRTYGYNELNLLMEMTNGRGQATGYKYDDIGRLISFTDPDGTVSYTYDANGNILTVKDRNGTSTREYDKLSRITQYTDFNGNVIKYSYDTVGNLIALTYPGGRIVRYEYNEVNSLVKVIDWEDRVTKYEYDANGRLVKTIRPNGTVMTLSYDTASQIIERKDVDAKGNIINQYSYTYDKIGNIIEEASYIDFGYNNMSDTVMEYDTGNRLIKYNNQQVGYDADGNMTYGPLNGQMQQFTYDSRNRLTSVGNTIYEYDAENNRTAIVENGNRTDYIINPNALLSQVLISSDDYGNQVFYIYGLGLIGQETTDGTYSTYHFDSRGSTTAITDETGAVIDRFTYAPYGELVSRTGDTYTPFLFNGREGVITDNNGLYYMRARYYNPDIKRFINQDVVQGSIENGLSLNRYAYTNGNPISYIDPFGLSPLDSEKTESNWFGDRWRDFNTGLKGLFLDPIGSFDTINTYGDSGDKILAAYSAGFAYAAVGGMAYLTGQGISQAALYVASTPLGGFLFANQEAVLVSALGITGGSTGLVYHIKNEEYEQIPLDILMILAGGLMAYELRNGYTNYYNGIFGSSGEGTGKAVDDFIKTKVNPNFQQNVKGAFAPDAKVTTLTKDATVYRYHGGTSSGKSYWYTPNQTSNPAADLALPAGNTYQYVDTYIIPKGTTILEGTVAPNFGQPGGGYQFYVPNPTVVIPK